MNLREMSLDILHYLLRFLNPHDLCKINQCSHLWRTLTDQEVIWKPLAINRWEIELKRDPIEMENQLKHNQQDADESNIKIWKNIYKSKYLQYKKYEKLIDQVSLNLFERLRTSYSVEAGEYIWEKLDTVSSIRSKPIHNGSNPQSTDTKADPSPVEIWKGIPADEYYARQSFTHVTVYLTKILFGVPYADVIKIVEHVEERHQWDQQLLQGWTLKRLDRRTDIIYLLFESMELLLLRQRHERVRTDGRRVSVLGQITPKEDELDEDVKQAVNDNRKSYFDDEDIDGLTRIKEQQGSGWCVEEIDPAQNTVRVSYQLRVPLDKPWETNVLFMAQATARAACLPGLEDYYHSKYIHQKTCQSNSNQK